MNRLKTIIAIVILLAAAGFIAFYFATPLTEDRAVKQENEGEDLLALHEKYPDVIGWIQVPGTNISYPVMHGAKYLYRDMKGESSNSGTPFVEDTWTWQDRGTLIYGHNMWQYKTVFNALHKFEKQDFYDGHKEIVFYAVCGGETPYVEKRTYRVSHCILTNVNEWDYNISESIADDEMMAEFLSECDALSMYGADDAKVPGSIIVLSTCSYHISGKDGRTVIVGKIKDTETDSIIAEEY